jgi:5-methylcytosine-specific restriction endonuclease McrA
MAEIYITSKRLIETLGIHSNQLIATEQFFDSISDDKWDLVEGTDYKIVSGKGLREYTQSGAYTIARYLEATQKQSFFQKIKEMVLHTKQKIRQAFIADHIIENCASLMKQNNQFFISQPDVVKMFKTRGDYLKKMLEVAQRQEQPLLKGQDYIEILDGGGFYFSLAGINKLAKALDQSQTNKNRQAWCKDVGEVIAPRVNDIVNQILERDKNIQKVMDRVRTHRDKRTCQLSGEQGNKVDVLRMAVHHLYSRAEYPHLADVPSNLITVSSEIHEQFHNSFMGGTTKPCTIDDFIQFVNLYYPGSKARIWLQSQKLVLGDQVVQKASKPHVLSLPASHFT